MMFPTYTTMHHPLRSLLRRPPGSAGSLLGPSPTAVVGHERWSDEDSEDDGVAPPSHAVDVLQLFDKSWFGDAHKARSLRAKGKVTPADSPRLKPAQPTQRPAVAVIAAVPTAAANLQGADAKEEQQKEEPPQQQQQQPDGWRSSVPVPTSLPKQPPPEALAVQQLPGIGTWAGRQRLFARPADLRAMPRSPSSGSNHGTPAALEPPLLDSAELLGDSPAARGSEAGSGRSWPVVLGAAQRTAQQLGHTPDDGRSSVRSEAAREEAWRWRFSRKWEAEQRKYYDLPEGAGSLLSNDDMDALQYTQACGIGVNLQFNQPLHRSNSRMSDGTLHTTLSCQFDVSGHGGSLALGMLAAASQQDASQQQQQQQQLASDGSSPFQPPTSPLPPLQPRPPVPRGRGAPWLSPQAEAQPSATNEVLSMVHKAQDLLQKQQQIEQEAQSRWDRSLCGSSGEEWGGRYLEPVQIGMSGRFRYAVVRVVDAKGRQRYVVRGRSRASPVELLEEVTAEAAAVCKRHGLPPLSVEPAGSGVMEWREDTDRHLHISAASSSGDALSGAAGSSGFSPKKSGVMSDSTALVASLVRQVLPCHFQVSTTSAPSRMASLMDALKL